MKRSTSFVAFDFLKFSTSWNLAVRTNHYRKKYQTKTGGAKFSTLTPTITPNLFFIKGENHEGISDNNTSPTAHRSRVQNDEIIYFKRTVAWDFLSKVISPKIPNWPPDLWSIVVAKIFNLLGPSTLWATAANLAMPYGPLWRIWWCAMGHCGEFDDVLCMGHCREFGYALWATVADLFIGFFGHCIVWSHTEPFRRIWLCAMGHSAGIDNALWATAFRYALWAVAQDFVMPYGQ
jgi:hypothetical protein